MDTIIYVVYREVKINSGSREADRTADGADSVRIEQFPMEKDFQIIRLTVCEKCAVTESMLQRLKTGNVRQLLRAENVLRCLADCFPGLRARRLQRERELLTEQIRDLLLPMLDRWGENSCIYAKRLQVQNESAGRSIAPPKPAESKGAQGETAGAWLFQALGSGIPEFQGYQEFRWIDRLLPYAKQEHFLALGTVGCIGQVFERLAPRAKSLLWIVPDYTYKAQVESVAERLYEEYGLAVDLRFLPEGAVFSRMQISGKYLAEPLNVLDFTGEKYVPPLALAPGSVWLDIGAVEEKEKRIKGRRMPVEYVSLRTLAEHPGHK